MKKMTLEAARKVADQTKATLPLVRQREGEKVKLARLAVRIAERAVEHAEEQDQPLAKEELRRAQLVYDTQLAEQQKMAADAVAHLKKLAHPEKGGAPVRLPPRRLRREASRVLTKEALRSARQAPAPAAG